MRARVVNLFFVRFIVVAGMMIWGGGVLKAQKIHYAYDDAGNRIKKEVVTIVPVKKEDKEVEKFLTPGELGNDVKLKVSKSGDIINVQIQAIEVTDLYGVEIYNVAGYKVFEGKYGEAVFDVEIGGLPKGVYVIRLSAGSKSKIWKIIKE